MKLNSNPLSNVLDSSFVNRDWLLAKLKMCAKNCDSNPSHVDP